MNQPFRALSLTLALCLGVASSQTRKHQRVRVGGNVQAAKLVHYVPPEYSRQMQSRGMQGVVSFNAVIGKDGVVDALALISGHPNLVASAKNAVRQWRYQTTLLNGSPVEVVTVIDVRFPPANSRRANGR